jgi:hypothetical protein
MTKIKIYVADWTFEGKNRLDYISRDVVTKKIPIEFLLEDGVSYQRAIRGFTETQQKDMIDNKTNGKKKVKITFKKFLGYANDEPEMD